MVLAALKYYSRLHSFAKKQKDFIELQLENCAHEGLILPFMQDFTGKTAVPYEIENSVLVHHYSGTDAGVFLCLKKDGGEHDESYPMKKVFDGIYIKQLLLFEGEKKYGYVYEEETGKRFPEMCLQPRKSDTSPSAGFFQMVNCMIEALEQEDSTKYRKIRKDYLEKHQIADKLFVIH
jgi:hypothetical protein